MDLTATIGQLYQCAIVLMQMCRLACSVVYYAFMAVADLVEIAWEHDAYQFSPMTLTIMNAVFGTAFLCAVFIWVAMCYAAVSIGRYRRRHPVLDA